MTFGGVEDFVIRKSDGTPSYNFAVVVDDLELGITQVIRGEEHLSNTARQTLLYRALGATEPGFIHLGLILGPDGKKLSKRHGAASVADYEEAHLHMLDMADTLSNGIMAEFPKKFR